MSCLTCAWGGCNLTEMTRQAQTLKEERKKNEILQIP